ncbi:MAG: DUF2085 domain-containing protein [Chloroflexi bacterium]|nr:DUF2085 domain-containing protein [Chloroflexota bacterium]
MSRPDETRSKIPSPPAFPLPRFVVLLSCLIVLSFLIATPGGCLNKADMVAYAVCHRIGSHSFVIGGRQLPLCARCTGTFAGATIGLFGQAFVLRRRRSAEFPPAYIIVILVLFIVLMAADGLNSYLTMFPNGPYLYEPRNWLRLSTGAFNGLAMSALIYPVFNFTLWCNPVPQRSIASLRDLGVLMLMEAAMIGIVLSGWPLLLYPVALLSVSGILALLTAINTIIVVMVAQRENGFDRWSQAFIPVLAGLAITVIQIGAIDGLRYMLTGTLEGFPPLQ